MISSWRSWHGIGIPVAPGIASRPPPRSPFTIEEAYEVADAIERGALFQVIFHAQIAAEGGDFDLAAVARDLAAKLVRRHPHVFADAAGPDARAQVGWEAHKATERAARVQQETSSRLDCVALALPAMTRAYKLQKRAAEVGFDRRETSAVLDAVGEELADFREAWYADRRPRARRSWRRSAI